MSDQLELERVLEFSLGPNSILMIQCEVLLSDDQRKHLRAVVGDVLGRPGRQCLVLDGGLTASILHRDDDGVAEDEGEPTTYLDGKLV